MIDGDCLNPGGAKVLMTGFANDFGSKKGQGEPFGAGIVCIRTRRMPTVSHFLQR